MNLENESAHQELLQVHERDNENNNGYEYQLHNTNEIKRSCLSFKELKKRLTYSIPEQDEISKKKAKISKIQLIVCLVAFGCLLLGLWAYNAYNIVVDFKFEQAPEIELPILTLCVPNFLLPIKDTQHVLLFRQFELANVTRPGHFSLARNVIQHCIAHNDRTGIENSCSEFLEYDGECIHVGKGKRFPWSLKTGGRTVLSIVLVYQAEFYSTRNLDLPFFGWNTTCHQTDTNREEDGFCTITDDQHLGINDLQLKNPFVLYQLTPDQLLLADIKRENHITSHGIKSTVYPTNFISFPFTPSIDFGDLCNDLEPGFNPCRVIYIGLRSQ